MLPNNSKVDKMVRSEFDTIASLVKDETVHEVIKIQLRCAFRAGWTAGQEAKAKILLKKDSGTKF